MLDEAEAGQPQSQQQQQQAASDEYADLLTGGSSAGLPAVRSVPLVSAATLPFSAVHSHSLNQSATISAATATLNNSGERLLALVEQMRLHSLQQRPSSSSTPAAASQHGALHRPTQYNRTSRSALHSEVAAAIVALEQHYSHSAQHSMQKQRDTERRRRSEPPNSGQPQPA